MAHLGEYYWKDSKSCYNDAAAVCIRLQYTVSPFKFNKFFKNKNVMHAMLHKMNLEV